MSRNPELQERPGPTRAAAPPGFQAHASPQALPACGRSRALPAQRLRSLPALSAAGVTRACQAGDADGRSPLLRTQEDKCLLITVRSMTKAEVAEHGPLPAAAAKRRRGAVNPGSCFRCEALPPAAGAGLNVAPLHSSHRGPWPRVCFGAGTVQCAWCCHWRRSEGLACHIAPFVGGHGADVPVRCMQAAVVAGTRHHWVPCMSEDGTQSSQMGTLAQR